MGLWFAVALLVTAATVAGYALADVTGHSFTAGIDGFAAGALLVMLIDSMIPEARSTAGRVAGLASVLGFAVAAGLSLLLSAGGRSVIPEGHAAADRRRRADLRPFRFRLRRPAAEGVDLEVELLRSRRAVPLLVGHLLAGRRRATELRRPASSPSPRASAPMNGRRPEGEHREEPEHQDQRRDVGEDLAETHPRDDIPGPVRSSHGSRSNRACGHRRSRREQIRDPARR